jgi:adenylate kinase
MNIIIFGPQGCGKGTQANLLAKKYGLYHLSMGDELREEIARKSALGKKIKKTVDSGSLVPDTISNHLFMRAYNKNKNKGIILDGYPRRKPQLDFVIKHIPVHAAIEIKLSKKESLRRISTRRICPRCERNYNTIWLKPKKKGVCDICKIPLVHRDDDKPKEITRRLQIYHRDTEPLRAYYAQKGILHVVNGDRTIAQVNKDIQNIVGTFTKNT